MIIRESVPLFRPLPSVANVSPLQWPLFPSPACEALENPCVGDDVDAPHFCRDAMTQETEVLSAYGDESREKLNGIGRGEQAGEIQNCGPCTEAIAEASMPW